MVFTPRLGYQGALRRTPHADFNAFGSGGKAVDDDCRHKAVDPAPAIGERWLRFFTSMRADRKMIDKIVDDLKFNS